MSSQPNYLNSESLRQRQDIKKIFFYRICGTGMGACAVLMREKGLIIEGLDKTYYPPMSDYLKNSGINCHLQDDVSAEYLRNFDLIIVGNVVAKNSDDAKFIESLGVDYCSFPAALGAFVLADLNVIGIAGTHGKTTTTYLMAQVFEKLGQDPGYFVGGVITGRPSAKVGAGKYFFIESDEYDSAYFEKISKFRSYFLNSLILTSLEFDHADIFETINDIIDQFTPMIKDLDQKYIVNTDYEHAANLKPAQDLEIISYGLKSTVGPSHISMYESGSDFKLMINNKLTKFKTNLVGQHNILNLATVILYASTVGFSTLQIQAAITDLQMVKRRQEYVGLYKESVIIDDFAHHPRAIKLTIEAVRTSYPDKKITCIFGPHSATMRSSLFQNELQDSFSGVKRVIIIDPQRATSVKKISNLDLVQLADRFVQSHIESLMVDQATDLENYLKDFASKDTLFLFLTNGNCLGLWESDFINEIV